MQGVSVILCCYNSVPRLPRTLQHLAAQQVPSGFNWEIILVDNASTDTTKDVARVWWKENSHDPHRLKVVDQPRQGLSYAREKGVEMSSYDILLFCDDDNWLASNYVFEAASIMQGNESIGALGGSGTAVADVEFPKWFEKYKGCYACYPQGDHDGELDRVGAFLYGAGLVVRKSCFSALTSKGFVPILPDRVGTKLTSGGDTELSYAIRLIGLKLWYSEKLRFSHYLPAGRLTEEYLWRLISSMSYCSGILVSYNYVMEGKTVTGTVWLKDAAYQLIFFIRASIRYLVSKRSLDKRLDFAFSYNRMRSVWGQAGVYHTRYQQIMKLKG
jgi:glycosyltransferase involved in cell wall biosynthesis